MGGGGNGLRQVAFRGRNDDGSETTATWISEKNTNWSQRPDRTFRLRLVIDGTKLFFGTVQLYYSLNGIAFFAITASSSKIKVVPTVNYTHNDDSTQQVGSGDFFTDNHGMTTDVNDGRTSSDFKVTEDEPLTEAEAEWSLQIVGDDVADGETLELRGQFTSIPFQLGYLESPIITVDVPRTIRRTVFIE
jgi:hypothetical protein